MTYQFTQKSSSDTEIADHHIFDNVDCLQKVIAHSRVSQNYKQMIQFYNHLLTLFKMENVLVPRNSHDGFYYSIPIMQLSKVIYFIVTRVKTLTHYKLVIPITMINTILKLYHGYPLGANGGIQNY